MVSHNLSLMKSKNNRHVHPTIIANLSQQSQWTLYYYHCRTIIYSKNRMYMYLYIRIVLIISMVRVEMSEKLSYVNGLELQRYQNIYFHLTN